MNPPREDARVIAMEDDETMPMIFIEGPRGPSDVAKKKIVADVTRPPMTPTTFPTSACQLHEYPPELYGQDGVIGAPVRPIATLEAPELGNIETKRTIVERIDAALAEAYEGLADSRRNHGVHQRLPTRASRVGGPDAERPSRDRRGSETARQLSTPLAAAPEERSICTASSCRPAPHRDRHWTAADRGANRNCRSHVRQHETSRTRPADQQPQEKQRCPST